MGGHRCAGAEPVALTIDNRACNRTIPACACYGPVAKCQPLAYAGLRAFVKVASEMFSLVAAIECLFAPRGQEARRQHQRGADV
jgi:hypothetical protein